MRKILLLDENIYDYKNEIDILKSQYDVDAVGYIETANYMLKRSVDYDLIVLDIMMPTLGLFSNEETFDGLKTGLVYYEKEIQPLNIPVLFWSWNSDFEEEIKWINTGFLLKKTDYNHLLDGVNRFFNKLKY